MKKEKDEGNLLVIDYTSYTQKKKQAFSFIEIVVVLVLLAVTSIAGISIYRTVQSSKFHKSTRRIVEKIKDAYFLARITHNCVDVRFDKNEQDIYIRILCYQGVQKRVQQEFLKVELLDAVKSITNNSIDIFQDSPHYVLPVYPSGISDNDTVFIFYPKSNVLDAKEIHFSKLLDETNTITTCVHEEFPYHAFKNEKKEDISAD